MFLKFTSFKEVKFGSATSLNVFVSVDWAVCASVYPVILVFDQELVKAII